MSVHHDNEKSVAFGLGVVSTPENAAQLVVRGEIAPYVAGWLTLTPARLSEIGERDPAAIVRGATQG